MKVVINKCYGGFGLSHEATMRYAELKGIKLVAFVQKGKLGFSNPKYKPYIGEKNVWLISYSTEPLDENENIPKGAYWYPEYERNDPLLVRVVEELGKKADGKHGELKIVDIPDGIKFEIDDYDGMESIHEVHKSWY